MDNKDLQLLLHVLWGKVNFRLGFALGFGCGAGLTAVYVVWLLHLS